MNSFGKQTWAVINKFEGLNLQGLPTCTQTRTQTHTPTQKQIEWDTHTWACVCIGLHCHYAIQMHTTIITIIKKYHSRATELEHQFLFRFHTRQACVCHLWKRLRMMMTHSLTWVAQSLIFLYCDWRREKRALFNPFHERVFVPNLSTTSFFLSFLKRIERHPQLHKNKMMMRFKNAMIWKEGALFRSICMCGCLTRPLIYSTNNYSVKTDSQTMEIRCLQKIHEKKFQSNHRVKKFGQKIWPNHFLFLFYYQIIKSFQKILEQTWGFQAPFAWKFFLIFWKLFDQIFVADGLIGNFSTDFSKILSFQFFWISLFTTTAYRPKPVPRFVWACSRVYKLIRGFKNWAPPFFAEKRGKHFDKWQCNLKCMKPLIDPPVLGLGNIAELWRNKGEPFSSKCLSNEEGWRGLTLPHWAQMSWWRRDNGTHTPAYGWWIFNWIVPKGAVFSPFFSVQRPPIWELS